MTTTSTRTTDRSDNLARKSLAAGRLAISAERVGNEEESQAAAYRCGALAHRAGISCDQLWESLRSAGVWDSGVWGTIVDGWHDTAEGL